MKDPHPENLAHLLGQWQVRPARDPGFRPAVRARLSRLERETWADYLRARGATWAAVALVLVAGAGWAGARAGEALRGRERDTMATLYLVDLDPRVQARLRP